MVRDLPRSSSPFLGRCFLVRIWSPISVVLVGHIPRIYAHRRDSSAWAFEAVLHHGTLKRGSGNEVRSELLRSWEGVVYGLNTAKDRRFQFIFCLISGLCHPK